MEPTWQTDLEQEIVQMANDLKDLIANFYDETDKINGEMAELEREVIEAGRNLNEWRSLEPDDGRQVP